MSRSGIRRSIIRNYVSLIIDPKAAYDTVVMKGANLLHLSPERCSLFHVSGCKIMNRDMEESDGCHPWSIGRYLNSTYSKHSAFKLGILCEDESSEVLYSLI